MLSSLLVISFLANLNILDGHYVNQLGPETYDNLIYLDVKKIGENEIKVQGSSYWQDAATYHTAELGKIIPLKDGKAIYEEPWLTPLSYDETSPEEVYDPKQPGLFQGCHAEITFKNPDTIHIEDNIKCGGLNVTFSGDYKRKSYRVPDWKLFDSLQTNIAE